VGFLQGGRPYKKKTEGIEGGSGEWQELLGTGRIPSGNTRSIKEKETTQAM